MELTQAQLDRQDRVDNACHTILERLSGRELPWDIELSDIVRDAVKDVIVDRLGLMTEMEFFPSLTWGGDD